MDRSDKVIFSVLVIFVILLLWLLGAMIYHDYKYKCLRGHYEEQYIYDPNLKMTTLQNVWICDEEMLREEYNKLHKNEN